MLSCKDIADYFLSLADDDAGDVMTNLVVQNFVYHAQGFHLALFNKPLFQEKIEAWRNGAVVPVLYHHYFRKNMYGATPIPKPKNVDFSIFSDTIKELLNEVYMVYGQYSAWKLRALTHEELPWKKHYQSLDETISHEEMRDYFKTLT